MKINTKVVHDVNYSDFERFVKQTYGHDYSFVADQECGNDVSHTFNRIDGVRDTEMKWDIDRWEKWIKEGKYSCMAREILNDLASKDLIPTGDYVIRVSW